jgi:hypothetical protein
MSRKHTIYASQCYLFAVLIGLSAHVVAQSEGNNAISRDTSGTIGASTDYIDASPFYNPNATNADICATLNSILTSPSVNYANNYPHGAVIDARGILPIVGGASSLTCVNNPFPASGLPPTTILLPGQTIKIQSKWILPSNTRIIGEGSGLQNYTAVVAAANFPINETAMIQMGVSSTSLATGVVIEHLSLDGGGIGNFDGVDNVSAGDGSYVNDVKIRGIGATASSGGSGGAGCTATGGTVTSLCIGPNATYSGPYTNFYIAPSTTCSGGLTCINTACAKIQAQTRGLHNITCVAGSNSGSSPLAAIYLDSYNNTIESVHVEGFQDAIVVGDNADGLGGPQVSGNTINTVTSSYGSGPVKNGIHICKQNTASGICSSSSFLVSDLMISQVLTNNPGATAVTAIKDDNVSQSVNSVGSGMGFVGLYAIGSTSATGGYARFTTNPGNTTATPTWGTGPAITNTTGKACTNSGAIYSNPSGTTGNLNTVYVCTNGSWVGIGN